MLREGALLSVRHWRGNLPRGIGPVEIGGGIRLPAALGGIAASISISNGAPYSCLSVEARVLA